MKKKKIHDELWRADMYRLLALSFDTPSEKNLTQLDGLLADLGTMDLRHPVSKNLVPLHHGLKNEREKLAEEYNHLFVTRSECPVSEGSYHLAERGPILGDVTAFYAAFQIRFHPKSGPPDSMKMELGFMHYLALKKVYALENKLTEAFQTTEDAEKKFLNEHLGRWAVLFADRLIGTTQSPFYQKLGSILASWVQEECKRFSLTPKPLPIVLSSAENENSFCSA